jgi:transcription initiation factor TFIIIB Brf1 subunit/transcription initiation factor TFIIB
MVSCLSDTEVTAKEIADTAQCTEGTLKSAYRILLEEKEFYVDGLGMKYGVEKLPP